MRNTRSFHLRLPASLLFAAGIGLTCSAASAAEISSGAGLSATIVESTGGYQIRMKNPSWIFGGSVGGGLQHATARHGQDGLGSYQEITFSWREGRLPMAGSIRLYDHEPVALFSDECQIATELPPAPFPSFTNLPPALHLFSYRHATFAPPQFSASDCSTPWLLFDDQANAVIVSPASHFMVASMVGDGVRQVASGFNSRLRHLPAGFTQRTLLALDHGINRTWEVWGRALTTLEGVRRPHNDADTVLKYLGYWTDNGAYYYYNYDPEKGYAGTLEALVAHYRREHIPIRYLQLDSWWYPKSFTGPDGKVGGTKSKRLPPGKWNRFGGILEYKADPSLFPNGLAAFRKSIGLPLVTHSRWVDPASPYREHYRISGLAAVDPKWWSHIAAYLKSSGVVTYEQDWLDRIYRYSPAFGSNVNTGKQFLDEMAAACQREGLTMQYCMPYPCFFLQGASYGNLTTIRTSDDRFNPSRWNNFLYVSRLSSALGIWPWADVFNSAETNNLLLATLSAGPVGIGDAIGRESKANLLKAVRADGVIVKPDAPMVPLDRCYLADARQAGDPLIAAAFTRHGNVKTSYVFAFDRSERRTEEVRFEPSELGYTGAVYVYDYFSRKGERLGPTAAFTARLAPGAVAYYIVAPVGSSGIAFLGDLNKFVSGSPQRIASLDDMPGSLTVQVVLAASEKSVTLHGYAAAKPDVTVRSGHAGQVEYAAATRLFTVIVRPGGEPPARQSADPVRSVTVQFRIPTN